MGLHFRSFLLTTGTVLHWRLCFQFAHTFYNRLLQVFSGKKVPFMGEGVILATQNCTPAQQVQATLKPGHFVVANWQPPYTAIRSPKLRIRNTEPANNAAARNSLKCAATFSSSFVSAIHRLFSFWKTVWFAIRTVRGRWWRGAAVRWLCRCRFRRSRVSVSSPFSLSLSLALLPPSRELVRVRVCASCLFVVCVWSMFAKWRK